MEVWKRLERLKHLQQQALSRAAECREAVQRCEQHPSSSKMSEMIKTYQEGVDLNEEEAQMFGELIERDISEKKGVTCARKNDNI